MFFQGCPFRCDNCHNPELQTFNGGEETTTDGVIKNIKKHLNWYEAVAFVGGEPLAQQAALIDLLKRTQALGLERWLYTGYELKDVPKEVKELCDVIVAGKYVDQLKTNSFPASSNQKVFRRDA